MERVKTGIKGLDVMLDGGLIHGSITVLKGAPGTGKSSFGLEFIARGIEKYDEPGLIVSFEQFPKHLLRDANSLGFDLKRYEQKGKLKIVFTSPQLFFEEAKKEGGILNGAVAEYNVQRVLIDSVSHIERITKDPYELRELTYTFINALRRHNLTSIVTQEAEGITGSLAISESGVSYIADNIIFLRYVEIASAVKKAVVVLKTRASGHDNHIRAFEITNKGIDIQGPFVGHEGVLEGNPSTVALARTLEEAFRGKPT